MFSKNLDLEFDYLQPCFCPDEDDLYVCRPDSASPGEDIWKKFELLPSPTPGLQVTPAGGAPVPWGGVALGGLRTHDPVDWPSELNNLGSVIVQDCVWGGFPAHETLTRAVVEKPQGQSGAAVAPLAEPGCPPALQERSSPPGAWGTAGLPVGSWEPGPSWASSKEPGAQVGTWLPASSAEPRQQPGREPGARRQLGCEPGAWGIRTLAGAPLPTQG
uniref:Transcription regulator Myc N-terminal domain-containing protein n=1 Tax=Chelydra serpentina TaxID=8475 RepID=A0A8C3SSK5_CHESE